MPRAFTDREREVIRGRLVGTGRDLFARRGLRATTVEQLARGAAISKGAFYLFFPTKEALLLAVIEQFEAEFQERLEAQVVAAPREAVRTLLHAALHARDEHPLMELALTEETVGVLRTMTPEQQEAFLNRDIEMVARILGRLAARGVHVAVEPAVLAGLLRALVFVGMHRGDIGPTVAPMVQDLLIESLERDLLARADRVR
jgi:AcrR family transcriptional regulator